MQGNKWNTEADNQGWHRSSVSFDIPISADNIFLLSRGFLSAGEVEIVTSADQSKDIVTFYIVAKYYGESTIDLARACVAFREGGNHHGVGIFVSQTYEPGFGYVILNTHSL